METKREKNLESKKETERKNEGDGKGEEHERMSLIVRINT